MNIAKYCITGEISGGANEFDFLKFIELMQEVADIVDRSMPEQYAKFDNKELLPDISTG